MSFSLTTPQILAREKTVTRRTGWRFLQPGDLIQAVDRTRGFKPGKGPQLLAVLRITDVRVESLARLVDEPLYAEDEIPREGFPCWSRAEFVEMFCRTHGLKTAQCDITRIQFEYVD
jgi:hypothetical protein